MGIILQIKIYFILIMAGEEIYPNPVTEYLYIENDDKIKDIRIFDIHGL